MPWRSVSSARATVLRLAACYALALSSISLTVAAAPLVGRELAPSARWATLPVSLAVLATMATSLPASLLMGRIGRREGLLVGALVGSLGAAAATVGILQASFTLFCMGSLGIGALNGFAQFYRFAAADVADASWRPRAISWVLAGGVAAGVLGPGLAVAGAEVGGARYAGSYASILGLYAAIAVLLAFTPLPDAERASARPGAGQSPGVGASGVPAFLPARPLRQIMLRRDFTAAVVSGMVAYGAMALLMTATPLSMTHVGHGEGRAAFVIQMHVVAMFAPSFVTGSLMAWLGPGRLQAIGLAALAGTAVVATLDTSLVHFAVALVLLGIGWNFLFVTGSSLLTAVHRPAEKPKVQGVHDLLVFGTAAAGSFLAGVLQQAIGWQRLAWVVLAIAVVGMFVLAWARPRRAPPEVSPIPQAP